MLTKEHREAQSKYTLAARRILSAATRLQVIKGWPDQYIKVSPIKRIWLFVTFRNPPINPEWQKAIDKLHFGEGTVTFKRSLPRGW